MAEIQLLLHGLEVLDEGSGGGGRPHGVRVVGLQSGDAVVNNLGSLQLFEEMEGRVGGGELSTNS